MTSFDEVVIMLHNFDSNSEHTFFTLQIIFGVLLKIVSCDKRLILKEHLYSVGPTTDLTLTLGEHARALHFLTYIASTFLDILKEAAQNRRAHQLQTVHQDAQM